MVLNILVQSQSSGIGNIINEGLKKLAPRAYKVAETIAGNTVAPWIVIFGAALLVGVIFYLGARIVFDQIVGDNNIELSKRVAIIFGVMGSFSTLVFPEVIYWVWLNLFALLVGLLVIFGLFVWHAIKAGWYATHVIEGAGYKGYESYLERRGKLLESKAKYAETEINKIDQLINKIRNELKIDEQKLNEEIKEMRDLNKLLVHIYDELSKLWGKVRAYERELKNKEIKLATRRLVIEELSKIISALKRVEDEAYRWLRIEKVMVKKEGAEEGTLEVLLNEVRRLHNELKSLYDLLKNLHRGATETEIKKRVAKIAEMVKMDSSEIEEKIYKFLEIMEKIEKIKILQPKDVEEKLQQFINEIKKAIDELTEAGRIKKVFREIKDWYWKIETTLNHINRAITLKGELERELERIAKEKYMEIQEILKVLKEIKKLVGPHFENIMRVIKGMEQETRQEYWYWI